MTAHDTCTIRELVDGELAAPAQQLTLALTDSDTGEVLHPQLASSSDSVEKAIARAAAVHAAGVWTGLSPKERSEALRAFGTELANRAQQLGEADSLDTGVAHTTTVAMIAGISALAEMGAARIEEGFGHVEHTSATAGGCDQWQLPWGPAAIFLPWNAPTGIAIPKTIDALVAGCPVIIKPSEWACHFSGPFAEAAQAALPPGVVQVLHGDRAVGEQLAGDPRIAAVSYTGGVLGGTAVAELCARQLKPVDLELSGNNPVVVLPDAKPEEVVPQVAIGMSFLNGQWCAGPRRLIVKADQAETYVAALGGMLSVLPIGASTEETTAFGPLAHGPHQERVESQLAGYADNGSAVHRFGEVPQSGGHFVQPAVVIVGDGVVPREEVFGPVVFIQTYDDVEEAVALANDHAFGLSAYVFSADRDAARAVGRRLRAGLVRVNTVIAPPGDVPFLGSFWGVSGIGDIGLGQGANFFSGYRFVG